MERVSCEFAKIFRHIGPDKKLNYLFGHYLWQHYCNTNKGLNKMSSMINISSLPVDIRLLIKEYLFDMEVDIWELKYVDSKFVHRINKMSRNYCVLSCSLRIFGRLCREQTCDLDVYLCGNLNSYKEYNYVSIQYKIVGNIIYVDAPDFCIQIRNGRKYSELYAKEERKMLRVMVNCERVYDYFDRNKNLKIDVCDYKSFLLQNKCL